MITLLIFVQCNNNKIANHIGYQALTDYHYVPASIAPGTEIELLAFSGGKKSDENNLYYYQFIGIDKSNGDTIRILTPVISIVDETGVDNKIYTTPLQFNPDKGITTASFELPPSDTMLNLINQSETTPNEEISPGKILSILDNKTKQKEYVVINESIDLFRKNYKAAIGVLNFKQVPW